MNFHSFLSFTRRYTNVPPPKLYLEKPNGAKHAIIEDDLYRYTRHRWLYNEERELSRRYLRFNLQRLMEVAVAAVGNGATRCIEVLKCEEGLHNKAFILKMDNGSEVFAKLPNPNAGPSRYLTASEVATRAFLREVAKIPVPQVLAWSSTPKNPVEAEYIIEEKAPGTRLGALWHQWPRDSKLNAIKQIADIDHLLSSLEFSQHGCIFFRDDLPEQAIKEDTFLLNTSMDSDFLKRFTLGPLIMAELWRGDRENMKIDRGPWKRADQYAFGMGANERSWIKEYASPRMNYYRSLEYPERPEEGVALLSKYLKAVPYLVPQDSKGNMNVLWHPDLHLDNVFVDPDTCKVTCIVDWQGARVAPLFYQSCVPRMFRHEGPVRETWDVPARPDDFDTRPEDEKRKIDTDIEHEILHKYYEAMVKKRAPDHWAVLERKDVQLKRTPTWLVTGAWENQDLFFLRQSLISIVRHWESLRPDEATEFPVNFTKEELDLHAKEEENMDGVGQMLKLFRDQAILPVDGMVDPEDYETARKNCEKYKEVFLGLAKDEHEKELFSKLWPYQDRERL